MHQLSRCIPCLSLIVLPFKQDRDEFPQIEFGPEAVEEVNLGVLMALPQHEVTQPLNSRCSNEKVKRWSWICV